MIKVGDDITYTWYYTYAPKHTVKVIKVTKTMIVCEFIRFNIQTLKQVGNPDTKAHICKVNGISVNSL